MVINKERDFCITGTATARSQVEVSYLNKKHRSSVGQTGQFSVCFKPWKNARTPFTLSVTEIQGRTCTDILTYENVVFGYLLLCSGQSNVQLSLQYIFNNTAEILAGADVPGIRLSTVVLNSSTVEERDTSYYGSHVWNLPSTQYLNGSRIPIGDTFSALCWLTARDVIRQAPRDTYIGVMSSSYTGTPIRSWMSRDALSHAPPAIPTAADAPQPQKQPSALWNKMIYPLLGINPSVIIWSQGEGDNSYQNVYTRQFNALIDDWRQKFDDKDLPFIFINAVSFPRSGVAPTFADLRLKQQAVLPKKNVRIVNRIHLGDPQTDLSPQERPLYILPGIHPRNVQPVANETAAEVLHILFRQDTHPENPYLKEVRYYPSSITVSLSDKHLSLVPTANCSLCCGTLGMSNVFDIKINATFWQPVSAVVIDKESITITHPNILGVRYAYADYPQCVISNKYGRIALPFIDE